MRKKVLVLLEVTVDNDVPVAAVREHVAAEAQASRGQFTGFEDDWRADIEVEVKNLTGYVNRQRKIGQRRQ